MMANEQDDVADGELVASVPADPLRSAFAVAISALMDALGECPAREIAVKEIMHAHDRARERLIRRILN